jgi:hypothetical protein
VEDVQTVLEAIPTLKPAPFCALGATRLPIIIPALIPTEKLFGEPSLEGSAENAIELPVAGSCDGRCEQPGTNAQLSFCPTGKATARGARRSLGFRYACVTQCPFCVTLR